MLHFLADYLYIFLIIVIFFVFLYILGGESIIFFKKKRFMIDPKADERLMKTLTKYTKMKDYKVLGRTTLECDGKQFTYDAILLGYFGTVAFVIDPHGGQIYGDVVEPDWTLLFEETRTHFSNPVVPLNGSVKFFRDIYRAENVKFGQSEAMVVFTNPDASVAVPKTLPVCHISDLRAKLSTAKYMVDNGANIEEMMKALEKHTV